MPNNSNDWTDSEADFDIPQEKESLLSKFKAFDFNSFLNQNKIPILFALFGLILAGLGVFLYKNTDLLQKGGIEVIGEPTSSQSDASEIVVEIAGAVVKPGVYKLANDSRIEDLMVSCGGLSGQADRGWVEKSINRAAKLIDGQKIYIKSSEETSASKQDEQSNATTANNEGGYQTTSPVLGIESGGLVNINECSFEELDKLPGIGQVYGQKIIEQRPYSNPEELLSRKILPKSTYEKIKNLISVF